MPHSPTIYASAVLIGAKAVLIRGPSGAGKSSLAWALIKAARPGGLLTFARLVADDRALVEAKAGRLLVRPAAKLVGLIEIRGLGIRRTTYEKAAVVGLVVDLAVPDAARLPAPEAESTVISGISLPRLAVAPGADALPLVLAVLKTEPGTGTAAN
ncbi:MAG TPA: HPr kinase/phosphatase C-terminal domain-containing protein [Pseudolabrys sp.]|nr:HPr kinase/phosphatase C-terminal domain-containing protein [Pseudolabrys sp.]